MQHVATAEGLLPGPDFQATQRAGVGLRQQPGEVGTNRFDRAHGGPLRPPAGSYRMGTPARMWTLTLPAQETQVDAGCSTIRREPASAWIALGLVRRPHRLPRPGHQWWLDQGSWGERSACCWRPDRRGHRRVAGWPSEPSVAVPGTRREGPERGEHEQFRTEERKASPREQFAARRRAREHVPWPQEPLPRRGPEQRDAIGRVSERVEDAVTSDDERDERALRSPSTRLRDSGGDEATRSSKRDGMERCVVCDATVLGRSESRGDDVDIRQQGQSREDGCPADERPGPNAGGRGQPSYRGSDCDMAERRHTSVYRRRQRPAPTYVNSEASTVTARWSSLPSPTIHPQPIPMVKAGCS